MITRDSTQEPAEAAPRVPITPIQAIVLAVVILIAAGLTIAVFLRAPRPDRVWDWSYPGAPWASGVIGVPYTQGGMMYANAPLATVSKWYRDRLKVGSARVMAMQTSSSWFSRRQTVYTGAFGEGPENGFPGDVFVQTKGGQMLAMVVSRPSGETNTFVYLAQVNKPGMAAAQTQPRTHFEFLFPPNSGNRSSSYAGLMSISHCTVRSNWRSVERYYMERSTSFTNAAARVPLNVAGTLGRLQPPQGTMWPGAPPMGGFPTNEAVFLYVDPKGAAAVIRIHPTTNGFTDLIVAGAQF